MNQITLSPNTSLFRKERKMFVGGFQMKCFTTHTVIQTFIRWQRLCRGKHKVLSHIYLLHLMISLFYRKIPFLKCLMLKCAHLCYLAQKFGDLNTCSVWRIYIQLKKELKGHWIVSHRVHVCITQLWHFISLSNDA